MLRMLMSIVSKHLSVDDLEDEKSVAEQPLESQPTFLYSKETLEQLKKLFPVSIWKKGTSAEELAFSAGEQNVIRYIESRLGKESLKVINHVST